MEKYFQEASPSKQAWTLASTFASLFMVAMLVEHNVFLFMIRENLKEVTDRSMLNCRNLMSRAMWKPRLRCSL